MLLILYDPAADYDQPCTEEEAEAFLLCEWEFSKLCEVVIETSQLVMIQTARSLAESGRLEIKEC